MRIFKQLFYITLSVGIASLLIYIFGDESSKYTRIFMGLFTGSTLGCITALINYLGARKQFLENRYKTVTQMVIHLYGIKSLLLDIESEYKEIGLNYDVISGMDHKITAIQELTVRVNTSTADNELVGYTPLFCKNSINGVLANLQLVAHKYSTNLFQDFSKFNVRYLKFKYNAKPTFVVCENNIDTNRGDYKLYYEEFTKDVATFHEMVDAIIEDISTHMTALDKSQNAVDRKWSSVEAVLKNTLNEKVK